MHSTLLFNEKLIKFHPRSHFPIRKLSRPVSFQAELNSFYIAEIDEAEVDGFATSVISLKGTHSPEKFDRIILTNKRVIKKFSVLL